MPTPLQTSILVWAIIVHLVADWPLQTEWMVVNKSNLTHFAAWVHSGIHTVCLLLVLPWYLAVGVGIAHLLIDTRVPVNWWMLTVKGMPASSPIFGQIELWLDQVFHIMVLAFVVLLFTQ